MKGQLLAGMDKVAGELVHKHFCTPGSETENKIFNKIEIYGLIIYHETSDCSVHRFEMDFDKERSKLENGKQRLPLIEGFSRLVTQLQCRLGIDTGAG